MKTQILMLGWELPPKINGGLGTACAGLRRALWQRDETDVCFVLPKLFGGESREEGRLIALLPGYQPPAYGASYYDGALALAAAVGGVDVNVDLIHAHDWLTVPAAVVLRERLGKPMLLHIHSTEYDRSGPLAADNIVAIERAGMNAATCIVAVSESTRQQIIQRYQQPPDKVITIRNGVDLLPVAQRLPAKPPLVSFIGRVTYQKGPLCFVEAAYHMLRSEPDLRFVMAGEGDLLDSARDLAHSLGLERQMAFPGFLDRNGVAALLAESSAFVMPSVAEPFGIVALEAMAAEVPVVISRKAGVTEVVRAVVKVDPDDAVGVASAVLDLIRSPGRAKILAAAAQREVRALDWSAPAARLLDVYRATLKACEVPFDRNRV
jgi:glycosyltransferase involved in cell wall biosynthesis